MSIVDIIDRDCWPRIKDQYQNPALASINYPQNSLLKSLAQRLSPCSSYTRTYTLQLLSSKDPIANSTAPPSQAVRWEGPLDGFGSFHNNIYNGGLAHEGSDLLPGEAQAFCERVCKASSCLRVEEV